MDHEAWPWWTRGLRDLLFRKARDDGRLATPDEVMMALRAPDDSQLREALDTLQVGGVLTLDSDGVLWFRSVPEAPADESPKRQTRKRTNGRWANTTPEERRAAAQHAADARWGRTGDASSDASGDAQDDASGDASPPPTPPSPSKREREKQTNKQTARDACDDASSDASGDAQDDASGTLPVVASNLTEALQVDLQIRAQQVVRDPHLAAWLLPDRWPELLEIVQAWGAKRVGSYQRDAGVRAVVGLFSDGYTVREIVRAAKRIRGSTWAQEQRAAGRPVGLGCLTPEVVRRALDEGADDEGGLSFRELARARRQAAEKEKAGAR